VRQRERKDAAPMNEVYLLLPPLMPLLRPLPAALPPARYYLPLPMSAPLPPPYYALVAPIDALIRRFDDAAGFSPADDAAAATRCRRQALRPMMPCRLFLPAMPPWRADARC